MLSMSPAIWMQAPSPKFENVPVFQVTTPGRSHDAVGDAMDARGWNLDRQQGGLHGVVERGTLPSWPSWVTSMVPSSMPLGSQKPVKPVVRQWPYRMAGTTPDIDWLADFPLMA